MLQKLSADNNVINWFEIPVTNVDRAKQFYETVLDIEMSVQKMGDDEMVFFPRKPDTVMALSGKVSGALVKSEQAKPSADGVMIYINASPSVQTALDKVEAAGGKIVQPKNKIPAGLIAIIMDTEGNKIGLHSEP
jgi:predicted enzyme related to lactoylglutathione lyase